MDVTGIPSTKGTYGAIYEPTAAGPSATAAESGGGADTVTISEQAKKLARGMGRETAEEDYPLEAYRIPDWYVDLTGGYTMLSGEIGSSWEQCRTGYDRLGNADKALYDEYSEILNGYYDQERAAAGISNDIGDYWRNFLQNAEVQETVRQAVVDRLAADPRAVALMRRFDIEI